MVEEYQAIVDALIVIDRLSLPLDGVTEGETHLIAYLACLLSVYRGFAASDWGYQFVRTEWGSPFSTQLANAVQRLRDSGLIFSSNDALHPTEAGKAFVAGVAELSEHRWRLEFLEAACSSVLALPLGSVRNALQYEPGLRSANLHKQPRMLLSAMVTESLYAHFSALNEALGSEVNDLMVPSVVWLEYLSEAGVAAEAMSQQDGS